jgi:hypothetical protein
VVTAAMDLPVIYFMESSFNNSKQVLAPNINPQAQA